MYNCTLGSNTSLYHTEVSEAKIKCHNTVYALTDMLVCKHNSTAKIQ